MKSYLGSRLWCCALVAVLPATMAAVETVQIKTVLYLFKSSAIAHSDAGPARPAPAGDALVFTSPATVMFDREKLLLDGASYSWNGGKNAPPQFSVTAMPAVIALPDQAASIRADVPVQYLEKMPDGSLRVRDMSGNDRDQPHYELTLKARPAPAGRMQVTCEMEIVALRGREKIPGVDLEVGRPILVHLAKRSEFLAKNAEWSLLRVDSPSDGDYSLLLLVKVSLGGDVPAPAASKQ